jgi:hypothetical protein
MATPWQRLCMWMPDPSQAPKLKQGTDKSIAETVRTLNITHPSSTDRMLAMLCDLLSGRVPDLKASWVKARFNSLMRSFRTSGHISNSEDTWPMFPEARTLCFHYPYLVNLTCCYESEAAEDVTALSAIVRDNLAILQTIGPRPDQVVIKGLYCNISGGIDPGRWLQIPEQLPAPNVLRINLCSLERTLYLSNFAAKQMRGHWPSAKWISEGPGLQGDSTGATQTLHRVDLGLWRKHCTKPLTKDLTSVGSDLVYHFAIKMDVEVEQTLMDESHVQNEHKPFIPEIELYGTDLESIATVKESMAKILGSGSRLTTREGETKWLRVV